MNNKNIRSILLIGGNMLFAPLYSLCQDVQVPAGNKMEMHHETLGDKYLPNAYNNRKTSPAYKYNSREVTRLASSNIFTMQVNVDSAGRNILGDAANEPNIAVSPLNDSVIVIGWRQFDNVSSNFRQAGWSYTADAGQRWTFPNRIDSGVFHSDPVLDYDAEGNFYYSSLESDFSCLIYKSTNGGVTWGPGVDAKGGDKQWMTIDRTSGVGRGNTYQFWTSQYSTCSPGFFTRSANEDSSFESCTTVSGSPFWGTLAVGNAGELYIAGASNFTNNLVFAESENAQLGGSVIHWNNAVSVYMDGVINNGTSVNPGGLLGQVTIDIDRSNGPGRGNIYILAALTRISNNDQGDVMFARSSDGGLTWSSPVRVNDDVSETNMQWLATMAVAPNGRIDAAWLDTRDAPGTDSSALYYSYSIDEGATWSVNEKMSDLFDPHIGYPDQNKMGDYFDMISDNNGAHLAWTNTLSGEEDVYYSYITPDIATGLNEKGSNVTFAVLPNPTGGIFVIKGAAMPSQIDIYNVLGEKVNFEISNLSIDISSQPAGIYFLKLVALNGSSVVKKIIKE